MGAVRDGFQVQVDVFGDDLEFRVLVVVARTAAFFAFAAGGGGRGCWREMEMEMVGGASGRCGW